MVTNYPSSSDWSPEEWLDYERQCAEFEAESPTAGANSEWLLAKQKRLAIVRHLHAMPKHREFDFSRVEAELVLTCEMSDT